MKVDLIDYMGDDLRVVNAARVSFDKASEWEELGGFSMDGDYIGDKLSIKDQKLITYLANHNHWTPFSHVMITMRETVPIFVARQRFKHMVGFTYNEVSRRYVDDEPEFYYPDEWRVKPVGSVKQGSGTEKLPTPEFEYGLCRNCGKRDDFGYNGLVQRAKELYETMVKLGYAAEQARMVLPQSMYTSYYVTGSLAAWARAYRLRSEEHAQKEIRDLADQWNTVIGGIKELEHSWRALVS